MSRIQYTMISFRNNLCSRNNKYYTERTIFFTKVSKNLAKYRLENNYVGPSK